MTSKNGRRVYFDHEAFTLQQVGGVTRYFAMLGSLLPTVGWSTTTFAGLSSNQFLNVLPRAMGVRIPHLDHTVRARQKLNSLAQVVYFSRAKPTLVHKTYYSCDWYPRNCRIIITIHDMIPELGYASDDLLVAVKRRACERADHIITVSVNTKQDLIHLLALDPNRISVVPLASDLRRLPYAEADQPIKQPYLLYVGNRGLYKEFDTLLTAYANSARLKKDFALLCFGGGPFNRDERMHLARYGLESRVLQMRGDDQRLAAAYRSASAHIVTSRYEGFGLTVLEAMELRCRVVATRIPSTEEVAGEAVLYYPPGDSLALQETLEGLLYRTSDLRLQTERAYRRSMEYSWKKTVEATASIYQSVIET